MLVIFVIVIAGIFYYLGYSYKASGYDDLFKNDIRFEGVITKIQVSNNHTFGILQIKLTKSDTTEYDPKLDGALFPYTIKDSIAEVYTYIVEKKIGQRVVVNTNERIAEFFDGNTSIDKGDLFIWSDTWNLDYVKKHTVFREENNE